MPFRCVTEQYLVALEIESKTERFGCVTRHESVFMIQNIVR